MGVIAQWGPHKWELTSDSVKTIEKLTFSWSLNTDSTSAASGKAVGSSNEDLSIVPVTFSTKLLAATGADVRKEIEGYKQSIGGVYPLLIGGKQLGPRMQLMTVAASEDHLSGSGEMVAATVTFTFNEFNPKKREKASATAGSLSTGTFSGGVGGAGSGIVATSSSATSSSSNGNQDEQVQKTIETLLSTPVVIQVEDWVDIVYDEDDTFTVYVEDVIGRRQTFSPLYKRSKSLGWTVYQVCKIKNGYYWLHAYKDEESLNKARSGNYSIGEVHSTFMWVAKKNITLKTTGRGGDFGGTGTSRDF